MMQNNHNVGIGKLGIMDKRGSGILRIREIVRKKFDWDNIIDRYVEV